MKRRWEIDAYYPPLRGPKIVTNYVNACLGTGKVALFLGSVGDFFAVMVKIVPYLGVQP